MQNKIRPYRRTELKRETRHEAKGAKGEDLSSGETLKDAQKDAHIQQ
jgi:hypothetical protein